MKGWLLAISISAALFAMPLHAEFENIPHLVVKGEATVQKPADQFEVLLGVFTQGATSQEALNENNQKMNQVITNIKAVGLDESDFQTGRFRIQPVMRPLSKDAKNDKNRTISHYEVVNNIQVKTLKISLAEKILDAAVKGGANQVEKVNFSINNPQSYRDEAIMLATQYAQADAHSLATAAGVKLTRILFLSLDQWQHRPLNWTMAKMSAGGAEDGTPLESGNVEIQASVNLIYEIK